MRRLRLFSMAAVLALMLAPCALAGIVDTPPAPEPPPPASAMGITDTPPATEPLAAPGDPLVEVALNLLQSALSLF